MKKILKALFAGILAISLTACAANATESAVKNTVNSYFVSLEEGNLDDAYKYVSDNATTDFSSLKNIEESMNDMIAQYDVSDSTKKLFTDAFSQIIKLCVQSHKITKVEKVSDTEYNVSVDASILDSDTISEAVQNIDYNSFISGISSKVMEKYTSEGETAAAEYMMSSMATWFATNYTDALKNLKASAKSVVITVDQEDNNWLITSMTDE